MKYIKVLTFFVLLCCLAGCKKQVVEQAAADNTAVNENLIYKDFTAGLVPLTASIPLCYFIENNVTFENWKFKGKVFQKKEEMFKALVKGQIQFGVFSLTQALKIYRELPDSIKLLGVIQNCNAAIYSTDPDCSSSEDFAGKAVYAGREDSYHSKVLAACLKKQNLADKIELNYSLSDSLIPSALCSEQVNAALLSQPFASIASVNEAGISISVLLANLYSQVTGNAFLPDYVVVVNAKFAEKNREAVMAFEQKLAQAVQWTVENPHASAVFAEKNKLIPGRAVAKKCVQDSSLVWFNDFDCRKDIENVLSFLEMELPPDSFYFSPPASL